MTASIRQALGHVATEQWEGAFRSEFDLEHEWGLRMLSAARDALGSIAHQVNMAIVEAQLRNVAFAVAEAFYNQAQMDYLQSVMDDMANAGGRS